MIDEIVRVKKNLKAVDYERRHMQRVFRHPDEEIEDFSGNRGFFGKSSIFRESEVSPIRNFGKSRIRNCRISRRNTGGGALGKKTYTEGIQAS